MRNRAIGFLALLCVVAPTAQQRSIDDFFREFSDAWVRMNPNIAVSTRYFSGEEQDRLEQQLSSYNEAARAPRRAHLERGLTELARFDRSRLTDTERVSADLLRYQLQRWLDSEKYDHYEFPLDQHSGANIGLVTVLSVQHPLRTPRDASNYLARLGLVGTRMAETVEDAKQRAAKDLIPPRFILNRTIEQMRRFSATPAAQNPCRVGGAYIANALEHACNFNLWREWAKLETATEETPYKLPKLRKEFAGVALALANQDQPDTSRYDDAEIVYRVTKPKHVGLIFHSPKQKRVDELLHVYTERITIDFLAVAPAKERYDD